MRRLVADMIGFDYRLSDRLQMGISRWVIAHCQNCLSQEEGLTEHIVILNLPKNKTIWLLFFFFF